MKWLISEASCYWGYCVFGRPMLSVLSQTNTIQTSDTPSYNIFADIWVYKSYVIHFCIFKYEKIFFKPGSCSFVWSHIHKSWNVPTCERWDHLTLSIWQWFQFVITCQGHSSLMTSEGHEGTTHWWVTNFCDLNVLQFFLDYVTQMFDSIW